MNGFMVAAALLILLCLVILVRDSNRFVVREYRVGNEKVRGRHRYVFLSDLHNKSYGKNHRKLIRAIEKAAPEVVLLGGDILTAKPGEDFSSAVSLIRQLAGRGYPIYYANGNHEYRVRIYEDTYRDMYRDYEQQMTKAGVIRLIDKNVYLKDANIVISGLDIVRKYYKRFHKVRMEKDYIVRHVGERRQDAFTILLAHNPEHMDAYADYGAELVLAGHVHGGIVRLPFLGGVVSPSFRLFPKYDGGFFREKGTSMILSRGLGTHTIPIRFLNPGELIVLDVVHTGQEEGQGEG